MGVRTDAILWFGVDYGEVFPWPDDNRDAAHDAIDVWTLKHGPKRPEGAYKSGPEWDAYYVALRCWCDDGTSIVAGRHCSDDYPMYYVAISACHIQASRGMARELGVKLREPTQEQVDALLAFMEENNLPKQEPQWHLASYVG